MQLVAGSTTGEVEEVTFKDANGNPIATTSELLAAAGVTRFRYSFSNAAARYAPGAVTITFLDFASASGAGWTDTLGNAGRSGTRTVTLNGPTGSVVSPQGGGGVDVNTLNGRNWIDVTLPAGPAGAVLDPASVTDLAPEFTLAGPGVGTVAIDSSQAPVLDTATGAWRYWIQGQFAAGEVALTFLPGSLVLPQQRLLEHRPGHDRRRLARLGLAPGRADRLRRRPGLGHRRRRRRVHAGLRPAHRGRRHDDHAHGPLRDRHLQAPDQLDLGRVDQRVHARRRGRVRRHARRAGQGRGGRRQLERLHLRGDRHVPVGHGRRALHRGLVVAVRRDPAGQRLNAGQDRRRRSRHRRHLRRAGRLLGRRVDDLGRTRRTTSRSPDCRRASRWPTSPRSARATTNTWRYKLTGTVTDGAQAIVSYVTGAWAFKSKNPTIDTTTAPTFTGTRYSFKVLGNFTSADAVDVTFDPTKWDIAETAGPGLDQDVTVAAGATTITVAFPTHTGMGAGTTLAIDPASVADAAPEFTLTDAAGAAVALSSTVAPTLVSRDHRPVDATRSTRPPPRGRCTSR